MNKYFLICLISMSLIIYTNSVDCSTIETDTDCKAQSGCEWTTAKCTGDASCTSATGSKEACETVTYGAVTCTFNYGTGTCGGTPSNVGDDCANGANSATCSAIAGCSWTASTDDTCTGGTPCMGVTNPTSSTCSAASVAGTKCTYTAPGCSGEAAGGGEGATPEANSYGGACTAAAAGESDPCTTANTKCSNSKCVCKDGYGENAKGDGCVEIVAYGADCTDKACATTQTCSSDKKCVCATGYKEKSDKSGCEQDTSTTDKSNSSFIKSSLMILLGITIF